MMAFITIPTMDPDTAYQLILVCMGITACVSVATAFYVRRHFPKAFGPRPK